MKKLIILPLIIGISFATPKKKLNDCEQRFDSLLHYVSNDSVYFAYNEVKSKTRHEVKGEVKKVKYVEKTKRTKIKADKSVAKNIEDEKTNRNFFVNGRKLISQNSWLFALVLICGMLLGTPIGVFIKSFFKR